MFKQLLSCSLLLLAIMYSLNSFGQEENKKIEDARKQIMSDPLVTALQFSNERKTPSLIVFNRQVKGYERSRATSLLADYLDMRTGIDKIEITKQSVTVNNNIEVIEFQQTFKGIKVEFGNYK